MIAITWNGRWIRNFHSDFGRSRARAHYTQVKMMPEFSCLLIYSFCFFFFSHSIVSLLRWININIFYHLSKSTRKCEAAFDSQLMECFKLHENLFIKRSASLHLHPIFYSNCFKAIIPVSKHIRGDRYIVMQTPYKRIRPLIKRILILAWNTKKYRVEWRLQYHHLFSNCLHIVTNSFSIRMANYFPFRFNWHRLLVAGRRDRLADRLIAFCWAFSNNSSIIRG